MQNVTHFIHTTHNITMTAKLLLVFLCLYFSTVESNDCTPIPAQRSLVDNWFFQNVSPLSTRKSTIDRVLVNAEASPKIIYVRKDSRGNFRTITEALDSIPNNNANRVIVLIGPGVYEEKIQLERSKPFVTLYGDSRSLPTLVFNDIASKTGTLNSASLIINSDYFVGINLRVVNSAPRGSGQAVAMTIRGANAAFFNCRFHGFQDTLCDGGMNHFYKDCYVEGTVDFIFGRGKSIFLNTMINVISGDRVAYITAHARTLPDEDMGYSLVHSTVMGRGGIAYLGRPWRSYARVVFAYSELSSVVNLEGWSVNPASRDRETVYFGEYKNWGPGSRLAKRKYGKELNDKDAEGFLELKFINASTWLLPPPKYI